MTFLALNKADPSPIPSEARPEARLPPEAGDQRSGRHAIISECTPPPRRGHGTIRIPCSQPGYVRVVGVPEVSRKLTVSVPLYI